MASFDVKTSRPQGSIAGPFLSKSMADHTDKPASESNPHAAEVTTDDGLWLVSYADDDDREMTPREIAAALDQGEIDSNTIVWRDGMLEWKPIAETEALKAQLRRCNLSPETLRRRRTVLGGFGPVRQGGEESTASRSDANFRDADDDEPTVVQPMFTESMLGASEAGGTAASDPRARHSTAGNTLRIRTGEPPPVAPRPHAETPAHPAGNSPADALAEDAELDSLPSNMLVTAPSGGEMMVSEPPRRSVAPPPPTRGIMSRKSDPSIPRASLTKDDDGRALGEDGLAARSDVQKPPVPRRITLLDSTSPADESGTPTPLAHDTPTPRATALPSSLRTDSARSDAEALSKQHTQPPRSRRTPTPRRSDPRSNDQRSNEFSVARSDASEVSQGPKTSGVVLALLGMAAAAAVAFALGKNYGNTDPDPLASADVGAQGPGAIPSVPPAPSIGVDRTAGDTGNLEHASSAQAAQPTPPPEAPAKDVDTRQSGQSPALARTEDGLEATAAAKKDLAVPPRAEPNPVPPKSPAAPGAAAQADPEPTAEGQPAARAAGGGSTPTTAATDDGSLEVAGFDASAAATALANAAQRASACRKEGDPSGVARVTVTFANSGKATRAIVDGPPFAGTATGGCIAETMRNATVPPFSGQRVTVKKTVVIQ